MCTSRDCQIGTHTGALPSLSPDPCFWLDAPPSGECSGQDCASCCCVIWVPYIAFGCALLHAARPTVLADRPPAPPFLPLACTTAETAPLRSSPPSLVPAPPPCSEVVQRATGKGRWPATALFFLFLFAVPWLIRGGQVARNTPLALRHRISPPSASQRRQPAQL